MTEDDRSRSPRDAGTVKSAEAVELPRTFDGADNPQNDWGEPADEGALHGANHTRRPERTDALSGQGSKTRRMTKDIISRRV